MANTNVIANRMIELTGEIIGINRVFKNAGIFEGEICDLLRYQDSGITKIIHAPLIAK